MLVWKHLIMCCRGSVRRSHVCLLISLRLPRGVWNLCRRCNCIVGSQPARSGRRVRWSRLGHGILCGGKAPLVSCSSRGKRLLEKCPESIRIVIGVVPFDKSLQHMSPHSVADANVSVVRMKRPESGRACRSHPFVRQLSHEIQQQMFFCVQIAAYDVFVVPDRSSGIAEGSGLQQVR